MNNQFEQVKNLQDLLVDYATGQQVDDLKYIKLRKVFISNPKLKPLIPSFINTCRNLNQFWAFISEKFGTYKERRLYIWDEFNPLLTYLEKTPYPSDAVLSEILKNFDPSHIYLIWNKALDRRQHDPEGAITLARTLLETVCKSILEKMGTAYDDKKIDLTKLYRLTAKELNLLPSMHTKQIIKQILGGCIAIIEGLGSLRNRISDAHGQGKKPVRAAPRHAELAVNLSGVMASFLISTFEAKKN